MTDPKADAGATNAPAPTKKPAAPAVLRRYRVIDKEGKERLVLASHPSVAIAHVYKTDARVATTDDVERLILAGVKTEKAE